MHTFSLTLHPPRAKSIHLRFSGPAAWNELTDAQSVALMRVRAQVSTQPETLFAALKLLYGLKPSLLQWLFDPNFIRKQGFSTDEQLELLEQGQNLLQTLNWVGELDPDATFVARFRCFDFQFGTPKKWLRQARNQLVYHGPKAGLGNCKFDEFMAADKAYRDKNTPLLAAILYRPLDKLTGERTAFDHTVAKAQASQFAVLDAALLERISFSFGCTMLNLQKLFRHVFPENQSLSEQDAQNSTKKNSGSWLEVVIGLAKLDVTKIALIEQVNLYLALKVLDEQCRQAAELEAQLEKMKKKS